MKGLFLFEVYCTSYCEAYNAAIKAKHTYNPIQTNHLEGIPGQEKPSKQTLCTHLYQNTKTYVRQNRHKLHRFKSQPKWIPQKVMWQM